MIDRSGGFNYDAFYKWIADTKSGVFVEVGSFRGGSTIFMAENMKRGVEFYSIDPFLPFDVMGVEADFELFLQNIEPYKDKIKHLRMTSVEAAKYFDDGECDFIFIDAAHDYDNVKADIAAWLPKLKPDGILAGHDYCDNFPGVRKAVQEAGFYFYLMGDVWIKGNEVPLLGTI
jgi:predicted O-methyltransferase YrrM